MNYRDRALTVRKGTSSPGFKCSSSDLHQLRICPRSPVELWPVCSVWGTGPMTLMEPSESAPVEDQAQGTQKQNPFPPPPT